jgi:predicted enzyme related to lactoylglutathione lyase
MHEEVAVADFASHAPGTFSWAELSTSDQKAGTAFYASLFGWEVNDIPMGPAGTYTMFQMRGKEVAAAAGQQPQERDMGVPPHWNSYITVQNVDETVRRAQELGAKVFSPPFEVMDAGRMAVLQDPTGAVFQVWQANKSIGARILNEPGALCWTELTTTDTKAAEAFYTKLFGWTPKHGAAGTTMEYTEFSVGGVPSIGMMPKPADMPAGIPSYWMPYFQVADCDASAAKAGTLGGKIMVGPQDIPKTGRFAILTDPQGAMFAVFKFTPA